VQRIRTWKAAAWGLRQAGTLVSDGRCGRTCGRMCCMTGAAARRGRRRGAEKDAGPLQGQAGPLPSGGHRNRDPQAPRPKPSNGRGSPRDRGAYLLITVNWLTASQSPAHRRSPPAAHDRPRCCHLAAHTRPPPVPEHPVKVAVGLRERRSTKPQHLAQRLFRASSGMAGFSRRMASRKRPTITTSPKEKRSAVGSPGASCGPCPPHSPAPEPGQGAVFDDGFVKFHGLRLVAATDEPGRAPLNRNPFGVLRSPVGWPTKEPTSNPGEPPNAKPRPSTPLP